ncbi:MAG: AsmA-like C-terminal region-containing protein [Lacipirellulaceae bacterium]
MARTNRPPSRTRGGNDDGPSPILTSLVNGCWYLFRAAVALVFVVALAAGAYLYLRLDDETRRVVEAALARGCEPFQARVGGARLIAGRGVSIVNLELLDARPGHAPTCVLRIDELVLEGKFDVATLLRSRPRVERVVLRRPQACLVRESSGDWNLARLKLPDCGGNAPPRVVVEDATLYVSDGSLGATPLVLRNVAATLEPDAAGGMQVSATAENTLAKRVAATGVVDHRRKAFDLRVEVDGLELNDDVVRGLAGAGGAPPGVESLRATVGVRAGLRKPEGAAPIDWDVTFEATGAEVRFAGHKRPLSDVEVAGEVRPDSVRIDRAIGRWGDATVRAVGRRDGAADNAPIALRVRVDQLDVATVPYDALPAVGRKLWDRFQPRGEADLAIDARFDGANWSPRATMLARDGSFEDAEKFRYRLTGASGRIDLNGGVAGDQPMNAEPTASSRLDVDLTALAEGTPVRIAAAFTELEAVMRPRPAEDTSPRAAMPLGWIEITSHGAPITKPIIDALPDERTRRFVHSLRPIGKIDLRWRADRTLSDDLRAVTSLDLRLVDCQINYERFPYPLAGVTGWVRERDRHWTLTDLESRTPQGEVAVRGAGEFDCDGDQTRLALRLVGQAAPLDESLRAALPAQAQAAWAFLRPRGALDFTADVSHRSAEPQATVRLTMVPHRRSVTVEPSFSSSGYRYRLERLDGRFDWENGVLTARGARGEHGATEYGADGVFTPQADGGWTLALQGLSADRLEFQHDFLLAAPPGLRGVLETIKPRGGIDLHGGSLQVVSRAGAAEAMEARWDVALNLHQAAVEMGAPFDGVSGAVRLSGAADGASAHTAGELELDSLFWNDLQLTQVRGPLWADSAECLVGEGVARKVGGQGRRLTAAAYGGTIDVNSRVQLGSRPSYALAADLKGIDVARLSSEWLRRPESVGGKLEGRLELVGSGASLYGLGGKGKLAVSEANLYELPVLVRLLKVLRNRTPDNTAFDRCEAEFTLRGEQIEFQHLDLLGDAVSFYGRGEAGLDRQLDLVFHSVVGRGDLTGPLGKTFFGQASEQLMRVRVLGTTDAPDIRREALPLVSNVVDTLQNGFSAPTWGAATAQAEESKTR